MLTQRLSNLQIELLQLYARNISEQDLLEIKKMLAQYFAQRAIDAADTVWDEHGWTDDDTHTLMSEHLRTPYRHTNTERGYTNHIDV